MGVFLFTLGVGKAGNAPANVKWHIWQGQFAGGQSRERRIAFSVSGTESLKYRRAQAC
jgi:hypothetical protein